MFGKLVPKNIFHGAAMFFSGNLIPKAKIMYVTFSGWSVGESAPRSSWLGIPIAWYKA